MKLDETTLKYIREIAVSYGHHTEPGIAIISRIDAILEDAKWKLRVGQTARTKQGKYVTITDVHVGGYVAKLADDPSTTVLLTEADIDRGALAS